MEKRYATIPVASAIPLTISLISRHSPLAGAALKCPVADRFRVKMAERGRQDKMASPWNAPQLFWGYRFVQDELLLMSRGVEEL